MTISHNDLRKILVFLIFHCILIKFPTVSCCSLLARLLSVMLYWLKLVHFGHSSFRKHDLVLVHWLKMCRTKVFSQGAAHKKNPSAWQHVVTSCSIRFNRLRNESNRKLFLMINFKPFSWTNCRVWQINLLWSVLRDGTETHTVSISRQWASTLHSSIAATGVSTIGVTG